MQVACFQRVFAHKHKMKQSSVNSKAPPRNLRSFKSKNVKQGVCRRHLAAVSLVWLFRAKSTVGHCIASHCIAFFLFFW